MNVARKWVFPILRLVLIGLIALGLVKIAFFPSSAEAVDPAFPTGSLVEPTVSVLPDTISNDVTLPAIVAADPAVPVTATALGTVDELFIAAGATVGMGAPLYDIRVETVRDPVETTDALGLVSITQPPPRITFVKVLAPASGTLSALGVIHGQNVAVGDTTAQVAPPTFSVTGSLSPEQQYRLLTRPSDASVSIDGGPAPFTCTALSITTPLAGAGTSDAAAGTADSGTPATTVRCAVPTEVTVFSGLAAQITIAAGKVENVLVVPTTAVQGTAGNGVVWLVSPADGTVTERPVTLGMTDGLTVQIVDGLVEGDQINEFVPGAAATDGCTVLADGSTECIGAVMAP